MRNFILGFILALALTGVGYWVVTARPFVGGGTAKTQAVRKYHCPMHPTYVSDKPGDCPICGMKLVPIEPADPTPKANQESGDHRGHREAGQSTVEQIGEMGEASAAPGYSPVNLTTERQQLMGITLAQAEQLPLEQSIRTFGRVTYDETKLNHIHTKSEGYIEKLYVNYVGQFVQKGEPVFAIYSPELYATQKEYLLALRSREQFGDLSSQTSGPKIDLVESARERLALWDIGDEEIMRLEKTREPIRALTIYSPVTGFVTAKTAVEGLRVMPGDTLYDIVDLSSIWVMADVYEVNLPFVRIGQHAEMQLPYEPGKKFWGRVTFINPTLDEKTRTVKARIEFLNPQATLKPEMYGDVLIHGSRGYGVAVPDDAVISTGERNVIFVAKGGGLFEPREVTVGVKVRNLYEIKSGVSVGEQVVTGANFLLDSESKLKATLAAGAGTGHQHAQ